MTPGFTGSFALNGANLTLQPSTFGWENRDTLGTDGNGRPLYSSLASFQLFWGLMSTSELRQLILISDTVSATGTVVSDLPEWGNNDYYFKSYSGTIIGRPQVGEYFNTYVTDVRLVISNIRT